MVNVTLEGGMDHFTCTSVCLCTNYVCPPGAQTFFPRTASSNKVTTRFHTVPSIQPLSPSIPPLPLYLSVEETPAGGSGALQHGERKARWSPPLLVQCHTTCPTLLPSLCTSWCKDVLPWQERSGSRSEWNDENCMNGENLLQKKGEKKLRELDFLIRE